MLIAHFQKDCLSDDLSRERLTITYARENLAGHHVNLNACRIESILDNLSYNTGQELDRVLEALDDCDDFEGYDAFHADVQLQFAVVSKDGADWYRIRYRASPPPSSTRSTMNRCRARRKRDARARERCTSRCSSTSSMVR